MPVFFFSVFGHYSRPEPVPPARPRERKTRIMKELRGVSQTRKGIYHCISSESNGKGTSHRSPGLQCLPNHRVPKLKLPPGRGAYACFLCRKRLWTLQKLFSPASPHSTLRPLSLWPLNGIAGDRTK